MKPPKQLLNEAARVCDTDPVQASELAQEALYLLMDASNRQLINPLSVSEKKSCLLKKQAE